MTREVYHSSTMGSIPLSFTGRHLLQELREAVTEAITSACKRGSEHRMPLPGAWEPISRARGKLAKYMSELEKGRNEPPIDAAVHFATTEQLKAELAQRGYSVQVTLTGSVPSTPWKGIEAENRRQKAASEEFTTYVLPDIPEGYSLNIVGGILSISKDMEVGTISINSKDETVEQVAAHLCLELGVLRFGEFKLKSGRTSPYFFNAGLFNSGHALAELGRHYAQMIQAAGLQFDVLFGPAYEGIPLVASAAVALADHHGRNVPWAFNRKEAKDHGEGGNIVGAPLRGRILIVDDVITAGTAIRESIDIIRAAGATPIGVVLALDHVLVPSRYAGRT